MIAAGAEIGEKSCLFSVGHSPSVTSGQLPVLEDFGSYTDCDSKVSARIFQGFDVAVAELDAECRAGIHKRGEFVLKSVETGVFEPEVERDFKIMQIGTLFPVAL